MLKVVKYSLSTLILILMIVFAFIQYLKSDFNNPFDQNKLTKLKSKIEKSNSIPSDFAKVYELINPITNTNGILVDELKEDYKRDCPCLNVARQSRIFSQNRLLGNEYVLAWKLEKEFTQKECLDYYVRNFNFANSNIGICSASEYYFNKEVTELNFDENATLVIMMKNPIFYNPLLQPERLKKKLTEIKTTINY